MLRKLVFCLVPALAAAIAYGQQNYAQQATTIRAGIVVIDSDVTNGVPSNWNPHAWSNLDGNLKIKPAGWNIDNPDHASIVTQTIYNRWHLLDGATPAVGTPLTKQDAPYWEVPLDNFSDQQMGDYDVLLLSAHGFIALTPAEREKLRKFMDNGGVLWIDLNSNSGFNATSASPNDSLINNFPLPFKFGVGVANPEAYLFHPVLHYPYQLGYQDLNLMTGPAANGSGITAVTIGDLAPIPELEAQIPGDSAKLSLVYGIYPNSDIIAEGPVGDGYEVVTSNDVSTQLNGTANGLFQAAAPVYYGGSNAAAKLAVNLVSLGSQYGQLGRGARKAGSAFPVIGTPLLTEWSDTTGQRNFGPMGTKSYCPPVAYKGLLVVVDQAAGILRVYDGHPSQSVSGSGNPDDGIPDYNTGSGLDLIWQSSAMAAPISAPTCFETPLAPASMNLQTTAALPQLPDEVFVVDANGNLQGFDLFQHFSGANLTAVPPDWTPNPGQPNSANAGTAILPGGDGNGPYAPTYADGQLFVADTVGGVGNTSGRVWIYNTMTEQLLQSQKTGDNFPWLVGGEGNNVLGQVSGPPTVGYIPIQDSSGGVDRVLYVPTAPQPSSGTPNSTAGITSFWLGVRGEQPLPGGVTVTGTTMTIATRASSQGLEVFVPDPVADTDPTVLTMGPKVTIINTDTGDPLPMSTMVKLFGNQEPTQQPTNFGVLTYTLADPTQLPPPGHYGVRMDYTIDWGSTNNVTNTSQVMRGQVFLPDDTNTKNRRILDHITLGPTGTMYVATSTQISTPGDDTDAGGSYFAIQEQGRGNFVVLTRWDLYTDYVVTMNGTSDVSVDETVTNSDPLLQLFRFLGTGPMHQLTFMSSPVVSNGVVYVMAQGISDSLNIPDTILFAFDANPPVIEVKTGQLGEGFTILQPDTVRSTNKGTPEIYSVLQANQYTYEQQPGADYGVLRINNLSSTNRGAILNCLSTSQPLVIRNSGSPDQLVYPETNGSRWNPMLWYTVFTGCGFSGSFANTSAMGDVGPPMIAGNVLYLPVQSPLTNIVFNAGFQPTGIIYGINTQIGGNDPFLLTSPVPRFKPWQRQLVSFNAQPGQPLTLATLNANPDFVWPQSAGVTGFDAWRMRLKQCSLIGSKWVYGVVGGNGRLYAWSDNGIFGFEKADFLIADSVRVADIDSNGNPIWSTDQTLSTGPLGAGTAGNIHPLVNPTKAYPLGGDQILVVDTGGNRLAILDRSGQETRSFDGFKLDPGGYVPDGYVSGEPLTFSGPRDVAGYISIEPQASNPLKSPASSEYWVHYLVADSGNKRLVELVDRYAYDPSSGFVGAPIDLGVLLWHSPASVSGGRFSYTCLARVYDEKLGSFVVAAGTGNPSPSTTNGVSANNLGANPSGRGSIVIFNGNAQPVVIENVQTPTIAPDSLFTPGGSELSGSFTQPAVLGRQQPLGDLNSLTGSYTNAGGANPELTLMYTDATGAYEIHSASAPDVTGPWSVDWMLPRQISVAPGNTAPVYSIMRRDVGTDMPTTDNPLDFRPSFAERLSSGDVIVVNSYVGRYRQNGGATNQFQGEIIQIDKAAYNPAAENLGFNSAGINVSLPPITGTRSIAVPVFADRR